MIDESEEAQLAKAWTVTRIVWSALFGSLGVYLIICKILEDQLTPAPDTPVGLLKNILTGLSIVIFFAAYYVRKTMLRTSELLGPSMAARNQPVQFQHPLAGRYLVAILVAAALSESIGVFGLVLFVLSKDSATLYQFIGTSAIAMFLYRPRKEEFFEFVSGGRKHPGMAPE